MSYQVELQAWVVTPWWRLLAFAAYEWSAARRASNALSSSSTRLVDIHCTDEKSEARRSPQQGSVYIPHSWSPWMSGFHPMERVLQCRLRIQSRAISAPQSHVIEIRKQQLWAAGDGSFGGMLTTQA